MPPLAGTMAQAPPSGEDPRDLAHALSGDGRAFERIYRRHAARVHGLARRLVGRERADEATQEAFVRIWHRLASYRGEGVFAAWLARVATNAILSLGRELGREARRAAGADEEAGLEHAPAPGTRHDLALDLEAALEGLPPRARQVFCLHDVEGRTHQEVAALLSIDVGTSKSQLHRARLLLRERLHVPPEREP